MIAVSEGQAARRELPGGPQGLREVWVVAGDTLGKRIEFLFNTRDTCLVSLEVLPVLHVAAEQADLLNELGKQRGDFWIHCDLGRSESKGKGAMVREDDGARVQVQTPKTVAAPEH